MEEECKGVCEGKQAAAAAEEGDAWVKVTTTRMLHHGFQYKEGRNDDHIPWDPREGAESGLHFARRKHIHCWLTACRDYDGGAALLWDVTVPQGVPFVEFAHRRLAKASSIILRNPRPVPESIYVAAATRFGSVLQFVPFEKRTQNVCEEAVWTHPLTAFPYVPQAQRTETLCIMAVTKTCYILKDIPRNLRSEAVCLAAVRQGALLKYVPLEMRTEAVCRAAVQLDSRALVHVPRRLVRDIASSTVVKHTDNEELPWAVPQTT